MGLGSFFVALAGPIARKVLASLGFGIVSYAGITLTLNTAIDQIKSSWSGLGGDALNLIQLSGAGQAIGIICGAMVARVAMNSIKKLQLLA